ncbi:MAG: alpha/beta hydrolase [Pseudomonadota bacterium]
MIWLIRTSFRLLGPLFPKTAATAGVNLFYSPRKTDSSKLELAYKAKAKQIKLQGPLGEISTYQWGDSHLPKVMLVHGWEGRATHLYKFIDPILEHGFGVIAFDGPAHGDSEGNKTTLPLFAKVLAEVHQANEDICFVVAHSFGCGATAIAVNNGIAFEKAAFLSSPYSVENVVNKFGEFLRIPVKSVSMMHEIMETERWHNMPRANLSFSTLGPRISFPTLFIHDKDDKYVPYEDGLKASNQCKRSEFVATSKLGHNKILLKKSVVDKVINYLFGE